MAKIEIKEFRSNSEKPHIAEILFNNKTGKSIKYITFYLASTNSVGDNTRPATGFRVPTPGCSPGYMHYDVSINTGWFDDDTRKSLFYIADIEYYDGTTETLGSDEVVENKELDNIDKRNLGVGCFIVILIIATIVLCVSLR